MGVPKPGGADVLARELNAGLRLVLIKVLTWVAGRCFVDVNCQFLQNVVLFFFWGGACQVGFGTWVASQMPNQLDR